ncbi:InlB B-repeat-containing protein, partial [Candidatus Saccharibacteria bacterium]|nr:InlB B-repeat-containing protein [Candidatus Saccharibacteria bacterium]
LGYTLSIKGPADSTLYKVNEQTGLADKANSSPSSKIIPTMGTKENPLPIIGEDGSGGSFLGTWGYSMTNNLATGTFIGLNDAMTELTTKSSASGNGQTGAGATTTDTYPVYYGVSVAPTTEAGSYKLAESTAGAGDNVISYFLTTPIACDAYAVVFDANQTGQTTYNTTEAVSGSTTTQTFLPNETKTLSPNGFTRPGFRFLGWSTDKTALTATYTDEQSVSNLNTNNESTVTLYAIWQPKNSLTSITNMQQMTSAICNDTYTPKNTATAENTNDYFSADNVPQRTLSDTRDNKTYVVRKLADGNCWMAQNLDLDLSTSVALTSATTDLNSKTSWTPQENTRTAYAANWNSINASRSYDFGNVYYANGYSTTIGEAPYYNGPTQTSGQPYWHLGNSYNWYAAYAGTTAVNHTADMPDSICPKGWRLPKASGEKSFDNLLYTVYEFGSDATANIQRIIASPFNYIAAGSIDAGSFSGYPYRMGISSSGYKTSEPNNGKPKLLAFSKQSLLGGNDVFYISYSEFPASYNSAYGGPIRCVAR